LEKALAVSPKDETLFIIGGGEIYKQSIDHADCIELTRVHNSFEADTFFPEIDAEKWQLTQSNFHDKDERHQHAFTFETYHKI
jgi:dihydrofolate reductase